MIATGAYGQDWNLARTPGGKEAGTGWTADHIVRTYQLWGGAPIIAELLKGLSRQIDGRSLTIITPPDPNDQPPVRRHQSYASWSRQKASLDECDKRFVWRVDQGLGIDRQDERDSDSITPAISAQWQLQNEPESADLVILDDADNLFRETPDFWPRCIRKRAAADSPAPWVILKMTRPVAEGKLWHHLREHFADRLIVVMAIGDLRLREVLVSRGLSWEKTGEDLRNELQMNRQLKGLTDCKHVVVCLDTVGAFVFSKGNRPMPDQWRLVFDPTETEGSWQRSRPGKVIGYTTCLVAALARQVALGTPDFDVTDGVIAGLHAQRALHDNGYDAGTNEPRPRQLKFPIDAVLAAMENKKQPFVIAMVEEAFWSIMASTARQSGGAYALAEKIVVEGEEALAEIPKGTFGELLTVDRWEIESFRSVAALMEEYSSQLSVNRPLSIAVFGSPGSGKSFGIMEVAKAVLGNKKVQDMTFNLSQLHDPDALIDAMHQVRDAGLSGRLPLVFWDEFDSQLNGNDLGWLRYFLAPMQDGKFVQGQITHPIGRAIFVFAGGTVSTMDEFISAPSNPALKRSDFVSRLKGFVDILGVNPPQHQVTQLPHYEYTVPVRRAILLRKMLWNKARHLFEEKRLSIDSGVMRAFLHVGKYEHGARSIESIIAMSRLDGRVRFERSCLPPETQLYLHVDGKKFLDLVEGLNSQ